MDSKLLRLMQMAKANSQEEREPEFEEDSTDTLVRTVGKMRREGLSLQQISGCFYVMHRYRETAARFLTGGDLRGQRMESARILRESVNVSQTDIHNVVARDFKEDWGNDILCYDDGEEEVAEAVVRVIANAEVLAPELPLHQKPSDEAVSEVVKLYPKLEVLAESRLPNQVFDTLVDETLAIEFLDGVVVDDKVSIPTFAETLCPKPVDPGESKTSYHRSLIVAEKDLKHLKAFRETFPNQTIAYAQGTGAETLGLREVKRRDKVYYCEHREARKFASPQLARIYKEQKRLPGYGFYNFPGIRGRLINKVHKMDLMSDSTFHTRLERYQRSLNKELKKVSVLRGKPATKDLSYCEIYLRELVLRRDKTRNQVMSELDFPEAKAKLQQIEDESSKSHKPTKEISSILRKRDCGVIRRHSLDSLAEQLFVDIYGLSRDNCDLYVMVIYVLSGMLGQVDVDELGNFFAR